MPSSISHGLVAVAVGGALLPQPTARRCWVSGVLCAILLDLDAIGRPFGRGDVTFLGGHRAITHSLVFAVLLGALVAWTAFRGPRWDQQRLRIAGFLITATALHGVLDAFASYGDGVTLLWPFSAERYSSPWQPLKGPNEIWWIWLPVLSVILLLKRLRQSRSHELSMKTPTGTLLLMTLALGACGSDVLCLQDDPPAIRLVVSDRVSGAPLGGISGTVTSGGYSRPLNCFAYNGPEECFGWARSGRVAVQVTREGFVPWDTAGVQVAFTGGACNRPIMRDLVVRLQPTP